MGCAAGAGGELRDEREVGGWVMQGSRGRESGGADGEAACCGGGEQGYAETCAR